MLCDALFPNVTVDRDSVKRISLILLLVTLIHVGLFYVIRGNFEIDQVNVTGARVIESFVFAEDAGGASSAPDQQHQDVQSTHASEFELDENTQNPLNADVSTSRENKNTVIKKLKSDAVKIAKPKLRPKSSNESGSNELTDANRANSSGSGTGSSTHSGGESISLPSSDAAYLNNPPPIYPKVSKRLGEQGQVTLAVLIDVDGKASQVQLKKSSGFQRLDEVATETVLKWRYIPGKVSGVAQPMWFNIPINFILE